MADEIDIISVSTDTTACPEYFSTKANPFVNSFISPL